MSYERQETFHTFFLNNLTTFPKMLVFQIRHFIREGVRINQKENLDINSLCMTIAHKARVRNAPKKFWFYIMISLHLCTYVNK